MVSLSPQHFLHQVSFFGIPSPQPSSILYLYIFIFYGVPPQSSRRPLALFCITLIIQGPCFFLVLYFLYPCSSLLLLFPAASLTCPYFFPLLSFSELLIQSTFVIANTPIRNSLCSEQLQKKKKTLLRKAVQIPFCIRNPLCSEQIQKKSLFTISKVDCI